MHSWLPFIFVSLLLFTLFSIILVAMIAYNSYRQWEMPFFKVFFGEFLAAGLKFIEPLAAFFGAPVKRMRSFKPWVSRISYGRKRSCSPHIIIIAPHKCVWKLIPGLYPDLPVEVWQSDYAAVQDYLLIEEDVGSHLLGHYLAHAIVRRLPYVRVDVIACRLARGIIDGNRVTRKAVQPVFDYRTHPELYAALRKLHHDTLAQIWKELGNLHPQGLIIDCHSMASYEPSADQASPIQAVTKSPGTLQQYVDAFLHPTSILRPFDILTSTVGGRYLADRRLAELLGSALTENGINWAYNKPYPLTSYIMSALYLRRFRGRGITFDVPKRLLTEEEGEGEAHQLPWLKASPEKTKVLAAIIAQAVCYRLSELDLGQEYPYTSAYTVSEHTPYVIEWEYTGISDHWPSNL